ncbi:MAG TPA: glycosyltransferase family 39 protein [Opitutaceae bacterium]|nr:glycosyltransferase family 39 protein [Opitutaceae bacterium]
MDSSPAPAEPPPAPTPPSDPAWRRRLTGPGAAAAVLAAFWVLMLASLWHKSQTFDELGGATAGYTYWRFNDYRLDPESGNLPQRLVALPLLSGHYQFPSRDSAAWHSSNVWVLGYQWLYQSGNDAIGMLRRSRAVSGLLAVLLGALVWAWSRRLFGPWGGLLSLLLFVLSPAILANGALVTTDTAVALSFFAAVGGLWALLQRLTPLRLAGSALAMAALFVTKMSAPLIVPIALLLLAARLLAGGELPVAFGPWRGRLAGRGAQALAFAGAALVHALVAWAVIWASYGFRFSALADTRGGDRLFHRWELLLGKPDPLTLFGQLDLDPAQKTAVYHLLQNPALQSEPWAPTHVEALDYVRQKLLTPAQAQTLERLLAAPPPEWSARVIDFFRRHQLLPEAYLFGQSYMLRFSHLRNAFLNGEVSLTGWWWFFPYTFLVKTPLVVFGILALAVAAAVVRRRAPGAPPGWYATLPLWTLLGVYWIAAMLGNLNIGHRHLLPTYPPMVVLAGAAAWWLEGWGGAGRTVRSAFTSLSGRLAGAALGLLVAVLAAQVLVVFPNYLAFFNVLAGGPAHAYRHLVDSSLDWGQDLPGLERYLDRHPATGPVYLSYFGSASPNYYLSPAKHVRYLFSYLGQECPPAMVVVRLPLDNLKLRLAALVRDNPDYNIVGEGRTGANEESLALLLQPDALRLTGGTYCISASMLQPVMYQVQGPLGPWNPRYEAAYQTLAARVRPLLSADPKVRLAALGQHPLEDWVTTLSYYRMCRLARLTAFLREREPDDNVNHSILVYKLSDADVARAVDGPPPPFGTDFIRTVYGAGLP